MMNPDQSNTLAKFLYTLIYYFPQITTRKIYQLTWLYQRTYTGLETKFDWDKDGYCSSVAIDNIILQLTDMRALYPSRPKGGRPKYAFRWAVWGIGWLGFKDDWEIKLLETLKYYNRDENASELKIKTVELRIRNSDFQRLHSDTVRKTIDKKTTRLQRGGRKNPVKRETKRAVAHQPHG